MKNLKLKIRNITSVLFGRALQNEDNNWSLCNELENCHLTLEFNIRRGLILTENQVATFEKIKRYVTKMDKIKNVDEQQKKATEMYLKYQECGYIDNNNKLIKGIDIAITEYIS